MPATMTINEQAVYSFEGKHAELIPPDIAAEGIRIAKEIFDRNEADPVAAAIAIEKMESDQLLTREEALLCLVWDEAEEAAFKRVTVGWLSRDVEIKLKVTASS